MLAHFRIISPTFRAVYIFMPWNSVPFHALKLFLQQMLCALNRVRLPGFFPVSYEEVPCATASQGPVVGVLQYVPRLKAKPFDHKMLLSGVVARLSCESSWMNATSNLPKSKLVKSKWTDPFEDAWHLWGLLLDEVYFQQSSISCDVSGVDHWWKETSHETHWWLLGCMDRPDQWRDLLQDHRREWLHSDLSH